MKKIYLLIIGLCFVTNLRAQVSKTIEVTPGQLSSLLTETELSTITDLTLTGSMDARDFKTMRDSMQSLSTVNLSEVTIAAYTENNGTGTNPPLIYEADEIPERAFSLNRNMTAVVLPTSSKVINGYAFAGCSSLSTVDIPSTVTALKEGVFSGCSSLTSITLPVSITTIESSTFSGCSSLPSLTIPLSVTTIGAYAFSGCTSMTSVSIPATVTFIDDYAFYACISLGSLTIPTSLTSIGKETFSGLNSITSLTIPSSVTTIATKAFNSCKSLTSVLIPSSVTSIGDAAFMRCEALTSISIPSSITSINDYTFSGCSKLAKVTIPSSVTSIGKSAFGNCTLMASIDIPSSVTRIDYSAFSGCSSLKELTLPPSLTFLGDWAFFSCIELTTIHIPPSATRIGMGVFSGCKSIKDIYVKWSVPVELDTSAFSAETKSTGILHVPYGSKAVYESAAAWKEFKNIEEDASGLMVSTNTLLFEVNGGQTKVNITSTGPWEISSDQSWLTITPVSGSNNDILTVSVEANPLATNRTGKITVTGQGSTAQIITVTQKSFPEVKVITAGNLTYLLTKNEKDTITHLSLSGTLNAWDIKAIQEEMPLLTYLDISRTVMKGSINPNGDIDRAPFYYPDNWMPGPTIDLDTHLEGFSFNKPLLKELKLPSTIEVIGCFAFQGCSGLTSVDLPSTLKKIGYSAFAYCKSLTSITIPSSVTYMSGAVFRECSALKEIKIEAPLASISESTFAYCTSLPSVSLPNTITYIGNHAFTECTSLSSIVLPKSLEVIDNGAFNRCIVLDTIYSYNPLPPTVYEAFSDVDKSSCIVYVPAGSKAAYMEAEGWKEFTHIVEMGEFHLEDTTASFEKEGGQVTVKLYSSISWTASSDKPWLTVSPQSGTGGQQLTLTAEANKDTTRRAIITIYSDGMDTLTITVTQHGITVGLNEIENTTSISYHPNPFADQMSIEVENPLFKEVNVDIYSISGQKIRSLQRAQKGAKINCIWDGRDGNGQLVPGGIYLLKVNGDTRKVVKK